MSPCSFKCILLKILIGHNVAKEKTTKFTALTSLKLRL